MLIAKNLPECKSEQDKIKGCMWREHYTSGNLKKEIPYKNGKVDGIVKKYSDDKDTKLDEEIPYKNGEANGMGKYYYTSGKMLWEVPYKNSQKEGEGKIYEDSGKLLASITWQDNKAISGKCANGKAFSSENLTLIDKDSGFRVRPELITPLFKMQEICQ